MRERLAPPEGLGWLVASGLLLGAAHPPFELLVPSFVALVPLVVWLERLPAGREGRSRALRGGFWVGLLYYTLVLYWLLTALVFYTPLAVLAYLLPVLILAGFLSLALLGVHQARHRLGWPVWLGLPVFWTATEWLRAHLGPVSFPWMEFGASLAAYPRLIGAADLVGTRGISFWLVALNALLGAAYVRWRRGAAGEAAAGREREQTPAGSRRRRLGLLAAAWLVVATAPVAYSLYRWQTLELRPAARVAVLQPNVPEDLKMDFEAATDSALRSSRTLLRRTDIAPGEVQLVVLPETAFPVYVEPLPRLDYPGHEEARGWVGRTARRLDAAVLYGAVGAKVSGGAIAARYNSAYLVDASGETVARYDKQELVPMVERVPFVPRGWLRSLFGEGQGQYFGALGQGRRPGVMAAGGTKFGVLICYESIFASLSRRYRRAGADFLVNITNDAWFGREEPWWSRSSALWQHPAHLVMRAVENRIGVVRSANTGISELVDPLGRTRHRTSLFRATAFTGTVYTTDEATVFSRWGDWPGAAAALAALVAALWSGRRAGGEGRG